MHVAGLLFFEAGPLRDGEGGVDIERIQSFIGSKLHLIPRYRQRLARVPIERHPVWVDDAHFQLEYHIRHASVPRPGTGDQLLSLMGRIVSQQLDRAKPLWELHVVEGLEDDQFAMISKIHHCMIDGMAGVDLMAVLLNLMPVPEVEPPPMYEPRDVPTGTELVVRETVRRFGHAATTMRSVRRIADDAQAAVSTATRYVRAISSSLGSGWLSQAPLTPINGKLGPNRRFAVLETPLAELKEIKNALGGTVNDVVLATVAGGIRRYFGDRDFAVDGLDFRVMAPVSVRARGDQGKMGNQVAMWLVGLPVDEADALDRLTRVREATLNLKKTDQALGAATLVRMSAGAPATLVSLAGRLSQGARPFNMTVTNVPGPQFPLYMLESRLLAQFPLVPLHHGHGVGIALFSYDGAMNWGFNADYDLMDDIEDLVAAVKAEFDSLVELAQSQPAATKPKRRKRATKTAGTKVPSSGSTPKKRPPLGTPPGGVSANGEVDEPQPAAKKRTTG